MSDQAFLQRPKRRKSAVRIVAAAGIIVVLTGVTLYLVLARHAARSLVATHLVRYETVQPTILVRGDLDSSEVADVVCRVRSWSGAGTPATSIKWIIDNGTPVKRGQLLVQLDESGLREQLNLRR